MFHIEFKRIKAFRVPSIFTVGAILSRNVSMGSLAVKSKLSRGIQASSPPYSSGTGLTGTYRGETHRSCTVG